MTCCLLGDGASCSVKPHLELEAGNYHLPLPLLFCSTSAFSNSTFLATVITNNVMAHLGMLLHSFNFTQRDKEKKKYGFRCDNTEPILQQQVIKGPHPLLLYINKPEERFRYGNTTSEERDRFYSHCQRACDTIAITLPIMTPCITSNLVFRFLSPWNGGLEGTRRRGARDGGLQSLGVGAGTPVEGYILPMILFLSSLRPSHANRGHL